VLDGIRQKVRIVGDDTRYYLHAYEFGAVHLQVKDRYPSKQAEKIKGGYLTPMPGEVLKVLVGIGEQVAEGKGLVTLSSMKMENTICAEEAGVVEEIFVSDGQRVDAGVLLIKLNLNSLNIK